MRLVNVLMTLSVSVMLFSGILNLPTEGDMARMITPEPFNNATVFVTVTDANETPLNCYTVYIQSIEGGFTFEGMTNATGQVEISVGPEAWGPANLWTRCGTPLNDAFERIYIEPNGVYYFDVIPSEEPEKNVTIHGVVSDHYTDGVIQGISVMIRTYDLLGNQLVYSDVTGMDGSYELIMPKAQREYTISTISSPFYESSYLAVFLPLGESEIEANIELVSKEFPTSTVSFSVINASTGKIMPGSTGLLAGYSSEHDHLYRSEYRYMPNETGSWNYLIPDGEYRFTWNEFDILENLSLLSTMFIYVNGTDMNIIQPFDLPEMDRIDILVVNESGSVPNTQVVWRKEFYNENGFFKITGRGYTNETGHVILNIPKGEQTGLRFDSSWHYWKEIDYTPQAGESFHSLEVELQEASNDPIPMADVEITFMDSKTGSPVPNANLVLTGSHEGEEIWAWKSTNSTGIFKGEIPVAYYSRIEAKHRLGMGFASGISVTDSGENQITVYLTERAEHAADPVEVTFQIKNDRGDPARDQMIDIMHSDIFKESYRVRSDQYGMVKVQLIPGEYTRSTAWNLPFRQPLTGMDTVTVPPSGGMISDLELYPQMPLEPVTGHVFDSETGQPIVSAYISSDSYRMIDEDYSKTTIPESTEDGLLIEDFEVQTDISGFFRTYAMNRLFLVAGMDGYHPEAISVDMDETRSAKNFEIDLDPMPDFSTWLGFNVIDQDGNPIRAYAYVFDSEYDQIYPIREGESGDGEFNFHLYPGTFDLHYGNETLEDVVRITLNDSDVEGMDLVLRPSTQISGIVKDWTGVAVENVNVTLETFQDDTNSTFQSLVTDPTGEFKFPVFRGDFMVHIEGTDTYLDYGSPLLTTDGWIPIDLEIILEQRTIATVEGTVFGTGGSYVDGVPFATVYLTNMTGYEFMNSTADINGQFMFEDIAHGQYMVYAAAPESIAVIEMMSSGYGISEPIVFNVSGRLTVVNVSLPFVSIENETFIEITLTLPAGVNVSLDEPIFIFFSEAMNRTRTEGSIKITPMVPNMTYVWLMDDTILRIDHGGLEADTNYQIEISRLILNDNGHRFDDWDPFTWEFFTGNESTSFSLVLTAISIDDSGNISAEAWGKSGQSIYVVIEGSGSYPMIEDDPGHYMLLVGMDGLDYDTDYVVYFSDELNGTNRAPELSGIVTTPEAPVPSDDDDDDDDDDALSSGAIIAIVLIAVVLLCIIAILIVSAVSRSREGDDYEHEGEEVEDEFEDEEDEYDGFDHEEDYGDEDEEEFEDEEDEDSLEDDDAEEFEDEEDEDSLEDDDAEEFEDEEDDDSLEDDYTEEFVDEEDEDEDEDLDNDDVDEEYGIEDIMDELDDMEDLMDLNELDEE